MENESLRCQEKEPAWEQLFRRAFFKVMLLFIRITHTHYKTLSKYGKAYKGNKNHAKATLTRKAFKCFGGISFQFFLHAFHFTKWGTYSKNDFTPYFFSNQYFVVSVFFSFLFFFENWLIIFFNFYFYFILLYNTVLVLPYIV